MITDLTLGENIFNSPDLSIKMKILHAVNKSLDQITVAEICRNAGISRQTFYRHFESKQEILCQLLVGISQRLLDGGRSAVLMDAAPGTTDS